MAATQLKQDAIIILKDFHVFLRTYDRAASYETIRTLRDILPGIKNGDYSKNLIFLSPTLVIPEGMQKEITVFDYPLPDVEGLIQVIDSLLIAPYCLECFLQPIPMRSQLKSHQTVEIHESCIWIYLHCKKIQRICDMKRRRRALQASAFAIILKPPKQHRGRR